MKKFFKKQEATLQDEGNYKKLTTRNTLLTLFLFVSPFLLLFFIINYEISSLLKNQIYSHLADTVEENIKSINIFLQDREIDLGTGLAFDKVAQAFFRR